MTHKCEHCGTSFDRRGFRPYRFCSRQCSFDGMRPLRPSPEELRDMYIDQKMTANDIAAKVGRDPKTTWTWLKDAGIETRPRGSYGYAKGKPGHMLGKKHSPETIAKITAARRRNPRESYANNGQYLKNRRGAAHPNWKGGISPDRQKFYSTPEWKRTARDVWVRDQATCNRCGIRPPTKGPQQHRGHVHHIVSFAVVELRMEMSNLILLCAGCHRWVHSKANAEKEYIG